MKFLVTWIFFSLMISYANADSSWDDVRLHDIFASGKKIVMIVVVEEGIYMPPEITLSRLSYKNGGCWLLYEESDTRRVLQQSREVHFNRLKKNGGLHADRDKSIRELRTWRSTDNMTFEQFKESCVDIRTPLVVFEIRDLEDSNSIEEAHLIHGNDFATLSM